MKCESWLILSPLVIALCLWMVGAQTRTLWLDEFHSYYHSSSESWSGVLERARADNHPPLSFLLLRGSRSLFGDGHLALRFPSLLAGLIQLIIGVRFVRSRLGFKTGLAVGLIFALSSYTLMIVTEARMYALMSLCVIGVAVALVKVVEEGRGLVSLALFSLAGLHTHYDFIFYLAVTGGVLLVLCFKPLHRHAALRGIGVLSLVGVLFAPWASYGLMHQLEHGLPPGSTHTHIYALAESIGHMYFINVGLGGDLIRIAAICGVVLAGVLMIRGVMILRKRDQHLLYLCLAFGIVVPLLVFIVAHIYPRAAHNWRYVAGSALPVFVLAAAGGMSKPRIFLVLLAALLLCLSSLTLSNALSRGREDSRSAVDFILDAVDEKDTVLLAPTMVPGGHRTSLPWDYYSGRTGREEKLDGEDLLLSLDSRKINLQGTLFFMERGHSIGKLKYLKQRFDLQETNSFGSDLRVHQFRLR